MQRVLTAFALAGALLTFGGLRRRDEDNWCRFGGSKTTTPNALNGGNDTGSPTQGISSVGSVDRGGEPGTIALFLTSSTS